MLLTVRYILWYAVHKIFGTEQMYQGGFATVLITDPAPRKRTQELSGTEAGCQYASVDTQSFSPVSHVLQREG